MCDKKRKVRYNAVVQLRNRRNIQLGSVDFGQAFEHFIIQEFIAY